MKTGLVLLSAVVAINAYVTPLPPFPPGSGTGTGNDRPVNFGSLMVSRRQPPPGTAPEFPFRPVSKRQSFFEFDDSPGPRPWIVSKRQEPTPDFPFRPVLSKRQLPPGTAPEFPMRPVSKRQAPGSDVSPAPVTGPVATREIGLYREPFKYKDLFPLPDTLPERLGPVVSKRYLLPPGTYPRIPSDDSQDLQYKPFPGEIRVSKRGMRLNPEFEQFLQKLRDFFLKAETNSTEADEPEDSTLPEDPVVSKRQDVQYKPFPGEVRVSKRGMRLNPEFEQFLQKLRDFFLKAETDSTEADEPEDSTLPEDPVVSKR